MTDISTKLHEAIQNAQSPEELDVLEKLRRFPCFVIDDSICALFDDNIQGIKSVEAMFLAGMAKLPYPEMMIELWSGMKNRMFCVLCQTSDKEFEVMMLAWNGSIQILDTAITDYKYVGYNNDINETIWKATSNVRDSGTHKLGAIVVMIGLLMAHVAGIDRELVEAPPKLNKSRKASGKPAIKDHYVVRIAHVYDHNGKKIRITDKNRGLVSVHMRAGHTRKQNHGKQWMIDNPVEAAKSGNTEEYHIVWIAPVLVNYKDGSELPLPKTRVVKL